MGASQTKTVIFHCLKNLAHLTKVVELGFSSLSRMTSDLWPCNGYFYRAIYKHDAPNTATPMVSSYFPLINFATIAYLVQSLSRGLRFKIMFRCVHWYLCDVEHYQFKTHDGFYTESSSAHHHQAQQTKWFDSNNAYACSMDHMGSTTVNR